MTDDKCLPIGWQRKRKTKSGKEITLITSWDDGCIDDLRIADLLKDYGLHGIFYVPLASKELSDSDVHKLSRSFEIGAHTITHRILRDIHPEECYCELKDSKDRLEDMIGRPVHSLCYPRGRYNENVKRIAKDLGYYEARTTKVLNMFEPTDKMEVITTAHVYNRREYDGIYWLDMARSLFKKVIDPQSQYNYFHLWGHGWEISKFNYWDDLNRLFIYIDESLSPNT